MIAFPERIDPMKEAAEHAAKIPRGPVSPFGDACQECGGELAGSICKSCGAVHSPPIDSPADGYAVYHGGLLHSVHMTRPLTDEEVESLQAKTGGLRFEISNPSASYADYSTYLLQTIAANLGIPTEVINARPAMQPIAESAEQLRQFMARTER